MGLLGTKAFISIISYRPDPGSMTFSWFQLSEQLLMKEGTAIKPLEARLKGPQKLIKIRRLDHLRPFYCSVTQ